MTVKRRIASSDPYKVQFEQAIAQSKSDFVKEILSDHKITASEFGEAQDRFTSCLDDAGVQWERTAAAAGFATVSTIAIESGAADSDAPKKCAEAWTGMIESLYMMANQNPANKDMNDLIAACLTEHGLMSEDLTGKDVEEAFEAGSVRGEVGEDGTAVPVAPGAVPDPILPDGTNLNSTETYPCITNPLNPAAVETG